tara:strand:+ start:8285 stop:8860 length:576 start_codon:yes stop_codon:yes gene_type:complete
MRSFLKVLEEDNNSTSEQIVALKEKIRIQSFSKGDIVQRQGEKCANLYYVKKGLLRSYIIDSKGKEHIFMFAPEGWLIADGTVGSEVTELFIDALEDTEVEVMDQVVFRKQFLPLTALSDINRAEGMLRRMATLQKRIIMLISATAIERYEHFQQMYPAIIQRVPQKMIASYLGITPEALSKVKSQRFKEL